MKSTKLLIRLELHGETGRIRIEEGGDHAHVYLDHKGNKTVGIGHLIQEGSDEDLTYDVGSFVDLDRRYLWWREDLQDACDDAIRFLGGRSVPLEAKCIIAHMAFQMGYDSLSTFVKFKEELINKQYRAASQEMLDSEWHKQTRNRCRRLARRMRRLQPE